MESWIKDLLDSGTEDSLEGQRWGEGSMSLATLIHFSNPAEAVECESPGAQSIPKFRGFGQ